MKFNVGMPAAAVIAARTDARMRILIAAIAVLAVCPVGRALAAAKPYHRCRPPRHIERRLDSRVSCRVARDVARDPRWSNAEPLSFRVDGHNWECLAASNKVIVCQYAHRSSDPLVRLGFRVNVA